MNLLPMAFRPALCGLLRWVKAHDSGQSLVELALLLPLLTAILLGTAELARLAYGAIEVSNAARAGVQYGAQNRGTAADTAGMRSAATGDSPNVTSIQATATTFCTCSNGTSITCSNAATACTARIFEYVEVDTTATIDPGIHAPGLPKTYTLKGRAVMRVLQ